MHFKVFPHQKPHITLTMFQYKTLHDIVFTESKLFTLLFMLKNKTGSKAYACFMSGGNRVLEIFSGMV